LRPIASGNCVRRGRNGEKGVRDVLKRGRTENSNGLKNNFILKKETPKRSAEFKMKRKPFQAT